MSAAALAISTLSSPAAAGPALALRVVAEARDDVSIASVYGPGGAAGGGALQLGLVGRLGMSLDAEWSRKQPREGGDASLDFLPFAALVTWRLVDEPERFRLGVALGPTLTVFSERAGRVNGPDLVTTGTRMGAESRLVLQIDTGLVRPRMEPATNLVEAVLVELYGARRFQLPGGEPRFQLGAWRAGLGLVVQL